MRRVGVACLAFASVISIGCDAPGPQPPRQPPGPLAIRRPDASLRVFSGSDETPALTQSFEGAPGSVRVTMEIEGNSGPADPARPSPPSINDVLFQATGAGQLAITFKRPAPEHPQGQVAIRCVSAGEESVAEFEPELWYHQPGAIITFEPAVGDPNDPVVVGKEMVLGRYVARNIPRDLRLSFKAVFTREPIAPRTKAGLKAAR